MKRVTASEARKHWFRLLDEVVTGAVVCIERRGVRILIQREAAVRRGSAVPDYGALIRAPEAERADEWGWDWPGQEGELQPTLVDRSNDADAREST